MRRIERSTAFKRDYRRVKAISSCRDLDERLVAVLELLVDDRPLPSSEPRPCLVVQSIRLPEVLRLVRLGSHSDLFE
jgi:mRNA-degrading endonuclease YafQ of YafQ-DinJ toxin-antitoxin module